MKFVYLLLFLIPTRSIADVGVIECDDKVEKLKIVYSDNGSIPNGSPRMGLKRFYLFTFDPKNETRKKAYNQIYYDVGLHDGHFGYYVLVSDYGNATDCGSPWCDDTGKEFNASCGGYFGGAGCDHTLETVSNRLKIDFNLNENAQTAAMTLTSSDEMGTVLHTFEISASLNNCKFAK